MIEFEGLLRARKIKESNFDLTSVYQRTCNREREGELQLVKEMEQQGQKAREEQRLCLELNPLL